MVMDKAFLDEVQAALVKEREELRKELKRFASDEGHTKDTFRADYPNFGSDEDENAAEVTEYENRLGVERNLEPSLQAVDRALAKIDNGTYGICEVCGKQIDQDRLKAMPSVATCADHHTTLA